MDLLGPVAVSYFDWPFSASGWRKTQNKKEDVDKSFVLWNLSGCHWDGWRGHCSPTTKNKPPSSIHLHITRVHTGRSLLLCSVARISNKRVKESTGTYRLLDEVSDLIGRNRRIYFQCLNWFRRPDYAIRATDAPFWLSTPELAEEKKPAVGAADSAGAKVSPAIGGDRAVLISGMWPTLVDVSFGPVSKFICAERKETTKPTGCMGWLWNDQSSASRNIAAANRVEAKQSRWKCRLPVPDTLRARSISHENFGSTSAQLILCLGNETTRIDLFWQISYQQHKFAALPYPAISRVLPLKGQEPRHIDGTLLISHHSMRWKYCSLARVFYLTTIHSL